MPRIVRTASIAILAVVAVTAALLWIDDAPDPEMRAARLAQAPVADENNLWLAVRGVTKAIPGPLHVAGRRAVDAVTLEALDAIPSLVVDEAGAKHYAKLRTSCRAVHLPAVEGWCIEGLTSPSAPAEQELAQRYRALRGYTGWATELREAEGRTVPFLREAQLAYFCGWFATKAWTDAQAAELRDEVRTVRRLMTMSTSTMDRALSAGAVERSYRLVADALATNGPSVALGLQEVLQPLPAEASDIRRVMPYEHAESAAFASYARRVLRAGRDPFSQLAELTGNPSPIPPSPALRRLASLVVKPEATANATLATVRSALELPESPGADSLRSLLTRRIAYPLVTDANDRAESLRKLTPYLRDMDSYVRLVSLVGELAKSAGSFDPLASIEAAGRSTPASSKSLAWDENEFAFTYVPMSSWLKELLTTDTPVVRVYIPAHLTPVVDSWKGIRASCSGQECKLVQGAGPAIAAKVGVDLGRAGLHDRPVVITAIEPGEWVELRMQRTLGRGTVVEQRVRVRGNSAKG